MIRLGICTDMESAEGVKEAGFDYIELKTYDVALAQPEVFDRIRERLRQIGLPCEALNFFYPPSMKVVGPDINEEAIDDYIQTALRRAGLLGVRIITVGSSKSRMVPAGFSVETAREQFAGQLRRMGELAEASGITIAIEPIRPSSTNFINTIAQAAEVCRMAGRPSVKVMADYYQMYGAGDPVSEIHRYGGLICHLHTIDIKHKAYPSDPEDVGQRALFQAYQGERASIEGADFTTVENAALARKALLSYKGIKL